MFLHELNPSIKALTVIILIILLALIFDPLTPLLFLSGTIILTFIGGKISWKRYMLFFIPFFILAIGMLWTTVAFSKTPNNPNDTITIFTLTFPRESFLHALALSMRILSVATLSLMFIFTTNVIHFIISLIQQFRLPPKIAYGVLAGYRFLPMIKDELLIINSAHRVRGMNQVRGIKGRMNQFKRFSIPLLASAIRKAERTAMAMESKGFTGSKNRTFYRHFFITKKDWLFMSLMILGLITAAYISFNLNYFKWYGDII